MTRTRQDLRWACLLFLLAAPLAGADTLDSFYKPYGIKVERNGSYKGSTFTYKVKQGETLFDLADRFLGDPYKASVLQKLNNISDPLRLEAGQEVRIPRPKLSLLYSVEKLSGEDIIQVSANHRFKAGDRFQLRVSANLDGFLYLFNRSADGDIEPLFPFESRKAARIRKYSEYLIPNRDWFRFDTERGNEELLVVVSVEPIPEFEKARKEGASERSRRNMREVVDSYFKEAAVSAKGIVVEGEGDDDPSLVTSGDDNTTLALVHRIRPRAVSEKNVQKIV